MAGFDFSPFLEPVDNTSAPAAVQVAPEAPVAVAKPEINVIKKSVEKTSMFDFSDYLEAVTDVLTAPTQAPAPVSEDSDRQFFQSGVGMEDRVFEPEAEGYVEPVSETTNVEDLEGPEAISSSVVQTLQNQTDTVSRGDEGNKVFNAQLRLAELGYDIGRGGTAGLTKNKLGKWVSLDNSQLRGVDSDFGPSTEGAVRSFQTDASLPVTGVIDPDTARALASKDIVSFTVPDDFTKNFSKVQNTNFNMAKDAAIKEGLEGAELSSFMSQLAHESDNFNTAEEYASGAAYEGRLDLGNTNVGDGVRYKGRGYIQLTGKSNYKKAGDDLGLDLINNPQLAEEPANAAAISLWFWKTKVRPQIPDFMDTERVTKVVNGGFNGLKEREDYFDKFTKKWNEAS